VRFQTPRGPLTLAEFHRLRLAFPFIAFMPQWDFLDFVTAEAARYPGFRLLRDAEALGVVEEAGAIRGVRYRTAEGERVVRARLTVAADGRASVTRASAGLEPVRSSPPMDVLWFRLSRRPTDPEEVFFQAARGVFLIFINRREYWQVGYTIPKGAAERVRAAGLDAFRDSLRALAPAFADRFDELRDWSQAPLLTVEANRLRRWHRPGLLCIGDAAHAMSPVAGVGINYAIQDAVVAANVLARPLRAGHVTERDLARVQHLRELPTIVMQAVQTFLQEQFLVRALQSNGPVQLPAFARLALRLPVVRNLPARLIAVGLWPVHVRS
jgi:2-polyprenyl-6-methoxyphenol hydroxylase-like FAD-dependent oxidoreductase